MNSHSIYVALKIVHSKLSFIPEWITYKPLSQKMSLIECAYDIRVPPVIIRISEREQTSEDATLMIPPATLVLPLRHKILDTFHSNLPSKLFHPLNGGSPSSTNIYGSSSLFLLQFFFSILDGEHKPSFGFVCGIPKAPWSMTSLEDLWLEMFWYPGDLRSFV